MQERVQAAVRKEVAAIFADVFKYTGPLTLETMARDVPKWDSLQHMALVAAIEQTFEISLSMDEMIEIRTVNDICQILDRHGV
jgi:acyl carrier protein